MVRYYFLAFLIISLTGCARERKLPDGLLTADQMVPFLIDIHIAEAKIKVLKLDRDSSQAFFRRLEEDTYQKHQITDSIYLTSYDYYLEHPDLMVEIYERVIDSLSLREKVNNID